MANLRTCEGCRSANVPWNPIIDVCTQPAYRSLQVVRVDRAVSRAEGGHYTCELLVLGTLGEVTIVQSERVLAGEESSHYLYVTLIREEIEAIN